MNAFRRSCFVLAVLAFASEAFADGCYVPELAVRKIPEIPAQRALLSWKDGQETLLISSALDSESQKLGWIIPLPSVPTTIEKATPGSLKTLNFCIQPKITHDLIIEIKLVCVAVFVGNILLATWLFKRESFMFVLCLLLLAFVFYSLLLPALGASSAMAAKASNVQVEKSVSVGAYDVRVLNASKPDDLNAWLAENGFSALPAAADKTIADYISNGWVFAAIKLTRAESGSNAPHPIKLVFSSKEPVYPLKLTALAGGSTAFEVFVIADQRAACSVLNEEFCDQFTEYKVSDVPYESGKAVVGESSHLHVGHPAICPLMWNNCILTKFAGTIDADKMTSDIWFDWKPFRPYRQHFYTDRGARGVAFVTFIFLVGSFLAVSMVLCDERIRQPQGPRRYLAKVLLPAVALSGILAVSVFACLPKLDASEVTTGSFRRPENVAWAVRNNFEEALKDSPNILQGTEKDIAEHLLNYLNGVTGLRNKPHGLIEGEVIVEDSPGSFTVEKANGKIIIRIYDNVGRVLVVREPKDNHDE
jgi:hypothetical protein